MYLALRADRRNRSALTVLIVFLQVARTAELLVRYQLILEGGCKQQVSPRDTAFGLSMLWVLEVSTGCSQARSVRCAVRHGTVTGVKIAGLTLVVATLLRPSPSQAGLRSIGSPSLMPASRAGVGRVGTRKLVMQLRCQCTG